MLPGYVPLNPWSFIRPRADDLFSPHGICKSWRWIGTFVIDLQHHTDSIFPGSPFIIIVSIGEETWCLPDHSSRTLLRALILSTEYYSDSSGLGTLYGYSHANTACSGATEKTEKNKKPQRRPFFPLHFPIKSFGLNGPFAALLSTVDCPPPSRGAGVLASDSRRHWQRITPSSIVRLFGFSIDIYTSDQNVDFNPTEDNTMWSLDLLKFAPGIIAILRPSQPTFNHLSIQH